MILDDEQCPVRRDLEPSCTEFPGQPLAEVAWTPIS
jgi:hypothetical protein